MILYQLHEDHKQLGFQLWWFSTFGLPAHTNELGTAWNIKLPCEDWIWIKKLCGKEKMDFLRLSFIYTTCLRNLFWRMLFPPAKRALVLEFIWTTFFSTKDFNDTLIVEVWKIMNRRQVDMKQKESTIQVDSLDHKSFPTV